MGNCFKKEQGAQVEFVHTENGEYKVIPNEEQYDRSVHVSTFDESMEIPPDMDAKKASSLCIKPGEEHLFSKKINIDDFEIEKLLGRGGYGKVYLAKKIDTGKYYAIKEIKKSMLTSSKEKANTIFERVILQNVDSPFIVKLQFAFQTPDKLYYVLDYCPGGELFYHLNKKRTFGEKRARFYTAECILALEELHRNKIIYRDLKPENILLCWSGHVMLTDFGLSKYIKTDECRLFTFAGTPEYLAPEIIKEKGYHKEVDWWSLGAILYEMLVGVAPFHNKNQQRLMDNILWQDLRFPDHISSSAKDLLKKLLERNPAKRLGSGPEDAKSIKEHKFFKWIDWEKLARKEVKPPFCPKVTEECDSRNFDRQFTDMRVDDTEAMPSRSIKEKRDTYIRDFTYYRPAGQMSGELDIEKILEANLTETGVVINDKNNSMGMIDETSEDLHLSYVEKEDTA